MRENEHPIDGVSQLDVYCDQLRQLGYLTLEQFLGAIEVVGDQLSQHLGVDVNQIVGQLPDTALAIPEDAATALTNADYALGFVVDELDGSQTSATGIDVSALPSATSNIAASLPNFCAPADVSLIAGMPSVRDQGSAEPVSPMLPCRHLSTMCRTHKAFARTCLNSFCIGTASRMMALRI